MSNDSQIDSINSHTLSSINDRAQLKFEQIKTRMKLTMFQDSVVSENYPQRDIDFQRIQELMNHPEQNDKFTVKDEAIQKKIESNRDYVDRVFGLVQSLGIPDQLAVAICLIISSAKTTSKLELRKAIDELNIFMKNFDEGISNARQEEESDGQ